MTTTQGVQTACQLCQAPMWISDDEYQSEFPPICPDCMADLDDEALPWSDDIEGQYLVDYYAPPAVDADPDPTPRLSADELAAFAALDAEPWDAPRPDDVEY